MYFNVRVLPGNSLGRRRVCLHGHCVCRLGSATGHLHTESSEGEAKTDGKRACVRGPEPAYTMSKP